MVEIIFFTSFFLQALLAFSDVKIDSKIKKATASPSIAYSFVLNDNGAVMSDKNLVETHTKILHLITYDMALKEFNHVHPEYNNGLWMVDLNLPVNGDYIVWVQGETTQGNEFSVSTELIVESGSAANPAVSLGDVRTGVDGSTQLKMSGNKVKAGKMIMLDFAISRTDGSLPNLSSYLGAFAHVIATSSQEKELIHVHPMEGSKPNTGMLHATFPVKGEYRIWIQFNDDNQLKTIPLSIVVE